MNNLENCVNFITCKKILRHLFDFEISQQLKKPGKCVCVCVLGLKNSITKQLRMCSCSKKYDNAKKSLKFEHNGFSDMCTGSWCNIPKFKEI